LKTIKLLSTHSKPPFSQIVKYWELIKYVTSKSVELDERDLKAGLIWLLHKLLSDKAQCWFRLDDERNVIAVVITMLEIDKRFNHKNLNIYVTFSYRHVSFEEWQQGFELLKEFAVKEQCDNIILATKNKQMMEMDKALGFKQSYTSFVYDLKGV